MRTTVIQPMSSTVATAQITAIDISAVGTASVAVNAPNLVTATPSVNFNITGSSNPMPSIGALSPSGLPTGSPDSQVTVRGSGFTSTSVVEWNSSPRATAYINGSDLVALIPATDLAVSGSAQIVVVNPAPGGGTSPASTLTIK